MPQYSWTSNSKDAVQTGELTKTTIDGSSVHSALGLDANDQCAAQIPTRDRAL
jgi:hypothetical protein